MDPVFTLQWPEFLLANRLQKKLPKKEGYSVFIPVSRQEKGIDLAILKKNVKGESRVATIQVKASRTYIPEPPKRENTKRFQYYTWFNRFEVSQGTDFFLLFGLYAPDAGQTKKVTSTWYRDCTLLLTYPEMKKFIDNCLTVKGTTDKMFGFGFDSPKQIFQTRGDKKRRFRNFSDYLLEQRIDDIKKYLNR
jgi:hypothetical protein